MHIRTEYDTHMGENLKLEKAKDNYDKYPYQHLLGAPNVFMKVVLT